MVNVNASLLIMGNTVLEVFWGNNIIGNPVEDFKPEAANFMLTICYQLHTASLSYASRSQSSFFYVKLLRLNSAQLFCVQ